MKMFESPPYRCHVVPFLCLFHFQFCIDFFVQPWDAVAEWAVSNLAVGQAIAGVVTFPAARGASIEVTPTSLEKLAATGCV